MIRSQGIAAALLAGALLVGCDTGSVSPSDGQDASDASSQLDAGDPGADPGGDSWTDAGDHGGADDGGGVTDQDHPAQGCPPLPPASGTIVRVTPAEAGSLRDIVMNAAAGTTILLADGSYDMSGGDNRHRLSFVNPGITLRSESGNPAAVILDGGYVTGELISITASETTIAELTLTRAYYHPIHVSGSADADIRGTRIYRVLVIDPGEQGIKINPSAENHYTDYGKIECSHIELTDAGRPQIRNNCYTGGIDGHQARGWEIRRNTIKGFWCDTGLSEHGIHLWVCCRDTLVEQNVVLDCARGIGFGLGETGNGNERVYLDDPYPGMGYIGHYDGIIRNNFVFSGLPDGAFDSGISLEQAHGTKVLHNTVFSTVAPFSSIEWRWPNTLVEITNNLVSHNLRDRGGTATQQGNVSDAPASFFVGASEGNLHLAAGTAGAIDQGVSLPAGVCDNDIDGDPRAPDHPDVGADEAQ